MTTGGESTHGHDKTETISVVAFGALAANGNRLPIWDWTAAHSHTTTAVHAPASRYTGATSYTASNRNSANRERGYTLRLCDS